MKRKQLDKILAGHAAWLVDSENGERADLAGANLQGADLQGADLGDVNPRYANLQGANLADADLYIGNIKVRPC